LTVGFLEGRDDPNPWANKIYKSFIQQFLNFYYDEFNEFDYEDFYDYYKSLLNELQKSESFNNFILRFLDENEIEKDTHTSTDLLANFDIAFNQLLFKALGVKWPKHISYADNCFPNYTNFLKMINYFKNKGLVNIHTLNHDLLIEILSHTDTFAFDFCDGYVENGSTFYGDCFINRLDYKCKVRLKYFNDHYPKKIRFYKLHGSVDNYYFNDDSIKIQYGISTNFFYKEIKENNELKYIDTGSNHYPDFLSGSTEKTKHYNIGHYKVIFEHFRSNLSNSKNLIVIGYSFGDAVINDYINKYFLKDEESKMLIIDISKNKNIDEFLELNNVEFIKKSISDLTIKDIDDNLGLDIEGYFSNIEKAKKDSLSKIFL